MAATASGTNGTNAFKPGVTVEMMTPSDKRDLQRQRNKSHLGKTRNTGILNVDSENHLGMWECSMYEKTCMAEISHA